MFKTKKIKIIEVVMILFLLSYIFIPVSYADDWSTINNDVIESSETSTENNSGESLSPTDETNYSSPGLEGKDAIYSGNIDATNIYNASGGMLPTTTTDEILIWATTKGNELIYFSQSLIQPISILVFIIGGFIVLIGGLGRGDMVGKGVWTMISSIFVYAAVLYAPVILQTAVGWVSS